MLYDSEELNLISGDFQAKAAPERTVLQALKNEASLLYKGLTNQEYLDYCFVKGACGQTIPLALLVPIGLILGIINISARALINISNGDSILTTITQGLLQITGLSIVLYLLLKACEVIPKKINNPLLVGRVTTYLFMCLLVSEGLIVVQERQVENSARAYHTSQFWVVFALLIWQKVLQTFIYDFKIRSAAFLFLYLYYALRVSSESYRWSYNLLKATIYIALEFVMIVDTELKNYAQYQLENSMHQRVTKIQNGEQVQFMIPPVSMFQQIQVLESLSSIFPIAIFDYSKELMHVSGITIKQLQVESQNDLTIVEAKLRKLEVLKVYNQQEQSQIKLNRLKKQAKFASCGTNNKGELLHSLIDGPALQQLRQGQQFNEQPRVINYSTEGIMEQLLNDLINTDQQSLYGVVQVKINENTSKQFQFHLQKQSSNIILMMDDITEVWKQTQKKPGPNVDCSDLNQVCKEVRQTLQVVQCEEVPIGIRNKEIKCSILEPQQIRVQATEINFNELELALNARYNNQNNVKFSVKNNLKLESTFQTDVSILQQSLEVLLANSIAQTKLGFISVEFQNDTRPNCIQVSVEDTGIGISEEVFKSTKFGSLQVANCLAKILGPMQYNSNIQGYLSNKGLKIITQQDCGTRISFSVRNMANDQLNYYSLIDEEMKFNDIEAEQEEIMERYLAKDENALTLPKLGYQIKYFVIRNKIELAKELFDSSMNLTQRKPPKLAGMLKLQEAGRLKQLTTKYAPIEIQCECNQILLVNSSRWFFEYLSQLKIADRFTLATEGEAVQTVNVKIKESQCKGCLGFKKIVVNSTQKGCNYEDLIGKLLQINRQLQVLVLSYQIGGEVNGAAKYFLMPNKKWIEELY